MVNTDVVRLDDVRKARADDFNVCFKRGMDLVEETADYLDGRGRRESLHLPVYAQALYAAEKIKLTTVLMRIVSWLLHQRAVREGETVRETDLQQAQTNLEIADPFNMQAIGDLPSDLRGLISRTRTLWSDLRGMQTAASQGQMKTV